MNTLRQSGYVAGNDASNSSRIEGKKMFAENLGSTSDYPMGTQTMFSETAQQSRHNTANTT